MNRSKAVKELQETFTVLEADVREVQKRAGDKLTGFDVRSSIRAFSALVEGLLYQMRQVAIHSIDDEHNIFSTEELTIFKEQTFCLNSKGEIESKDNYERLLPMLLFTFKNYPRIHGAYFSPDTGVHGWECMKLFIKVRNRIMHPKNKTDLILTTEEWEKIKIGIDWFHDTANEMFKECDKADTSYDQQQ